MLNPYVAVKVAQHSPKIIRWVLILLVGIIFAVSAMVGMFVVGVASAVSGGGGSVGVNSGGWTHPIPSMPRWDTYNGGSHAVGAIDFPAAYGAPVYAAGPGIIQFGGNTGTTYGLVVLIQHDDGTATMYAHLSRVYVVAGQPVVGGVQVGEVGGTGGYPPHLHLEAKTRAVIADRQAQLPTYKYFLSRGVDLGPCFGGPCNLAGF